MASVLSVSFMSAESCHSEGHSPSEGQSSHDGELDETLQSEVINVLYTSMSYSLACGASNVQQKLSCVHIYKLYMELECMCSSNVEHSSRRKGAKHEHTCTLYLQILS